MSKIKKIKVTQSDTSKEYYSVHSIQKLNSEFDTNVFAATVPIIELFNNRDIILVEDLRGDARWGMNKVIQRNISKKRVKEIKNEYLNSSNRLIKFFPAITVVLLPKSEGEPRQSFSMNDKGFNQIDFINIDKQYEGEDYIMNLPVSISWDKNKISALVIDGQHRVSAIREYYKGKNENTYKNVSIPVSFVIFKNDPKIDLIQATRALFIDVNNTPRLVSEEKLIFIDDRNIQRRITAKILGANDPGNQEEDVYQKMLGDENFFLNNTNFINRYFLEESGKDDEEHRGFLSNHNSLFPWEVSNIMTIHKNILANIFLKHVEADKTRDIRSIAKQLSSSILDEIESTESVEELSESKTQKLLNRLRSNGLSVSELEIFNNLIILRKRHLEELQQAQRDFMTGSVADEDETTDLEEFKRVLSNIYNQDCSKDTAFEISSNEISNLLNETCAIYVNFIVEVYNGLWFTKQIKNSIIEHEKEDRTLIFNFILSTHEKLKIDNNIRQRKDKVDRLISNFFSEYDEVPNDKKDVIQNWSNKLSDDLDSILLKKIVGQEMLFIYLTELNPKLSSINLTDSIEFINSLGVNGFFNSNSGIEVTFFNMEEFKIENFNPWSEIIMKNKSMKPGLINAKKGADLILFIQNRWTNRKNTSGGNLRKLDKIQKSYGIEILSSIAKDDQGTLFKMYTQTKDFKEFDKYLTPNEIETIKEKFDSQELLSPRAIAVLGKFYGGLALEQIINHISKILENETL
ncbi:DNA-sulfur modification-associated [Polaribacter sp. KT25b]|uniref:DNA sulfur modification protein DndB n=1 Tax=Polaribacter sp. KT25b TaxID=1855336 RepID=UPI00087D10FB|nr:DNA sulfur modification protein DndB [Polaribacter sp. KT25b]SDS17851.1 DNA-sulfur modification-associated [Polaribacter sp. KT25b]